ncbi:replication factor A2 [Saccharata proteae CBS 121410]|uniref:Replication factor A2 n=1 Tax=Saccharata proteae CBS 121410 TaxID=1314787 RepID=A0A9P4HR63_9PEZI|nr:replication factor A2 [Saccharata proteae CBS 121410]
MSNSFSDTADYGYTSYGAQGGSGGGGFLPGGGSQDSPGSGSKGFVKDTLRPVTIKQINDANNVQESDFTIDGTEISQVMFIGQIRNISQQTTYITYKLDDGTGTVEVKQWVDSDASDPLKPADGSKPRLVENAYAKVFGKLRVYGGKRHVGAHIIRPVTDLNEVSYHLLEATAVHLYFTRGPLNGDAKPATNGGYDNKQQQQAGNTGGALSNLSSAARKIYECLKTTAQGNEGLHMQDIAARTRLEMADVARAGDELLNEGQIYTTVDETTWALLDV